MKSSLVSRFEPALQVLLSALSEPLDFRQLTLLFDHGSRKLSGQILAADADASTFRYQLPGRSGTAEAEEIIGLIRDYCALYDSCRVELYQRGQNRFFEVGDRGVRIGTLPVAADAGQPAAAESTRDNRIKINEAASLLQAIGIIDAHGRLRNDKIRKYNQIDRFVELAEPLLTDLAAENSTLQVYDLACGKSYLSFVLNYYIREKLQIPCQVHGIDISEGVVASSRQLAEQLGYRNMSFETGDLRAFRPNGPVDLCISLHACDVATDFALAAAINARSRAIIAVPCCQRELLASGFSLPETLASLTSHGVLKARLADLLTDSLRLLLLKAAGYETSLIEYISPLDTPKNLMLRARYTGRRDQAAIQEYRSLARQLGSTITLGRIMEETDYGRHTGYEEFR